MSIGTRHRILWVTTVPPWPPDRGSQIRDFELMRRVSAVHDVTVLCTAHRAEGEAAAQALTAFGVRLEWYAPEPQGIASLATWLLRGFPAAAWSWCNPAIQREITRRIRDRTVDVLQVEHSFLAPLIDAVPHTPRVSTLLDLHNVAESQYATYVRMEARWLSRWMERGRAWLMTGWEARWAARYAGVVTTSVPDAEQIRRAWSSDQQRGRSPLVVPNAVDTDRLQPLPPSGGRGLLFVGNLAYRPNADAVRWLGEAIVPMVRHAEPTATLTVVGGGAPSSLANAPFDGVSLRGRVDDLAPLYAAATVAVVPLRAGGGTPLKMLEAMALGRPIVATSLACAGLDVRAGTHVLIEDDPRRFADAVVALLRDEARCAELSVAARALVEARYSWARSAETLLHAYRTDDEPIPDA